MARGRVSSTALHVGRMGGRAAGSVPTRKIAAPFDSSSSHSLVTSLPLFCACGPRRARPARCMGLLACALAPYTLPRPAPCFLAADGRACSGSRARRSTLPLEVLLLDHAARTKC
eukprot:4933917-Prymnesium_polylepis.1